MTQASNRRVAVVFARCERQSWLAAGRCRAAGCGVDSDCHDLAVREGRRYGTELRTIAYGSITED